MHPGTSYSLAKGGQKFGSQFSQSHLKGEGVIGYWIHYIHELKKNNNKNYPKKQFYFSSINTILCAVKGPFGTPKVHSTTLSKPQTRDKTTNKLLPVSAAWGSRNTEV